MHFIHHVISEETTNIVQIKKGVAEYWDELIGEPSAVWLFQNGIHPVTQQRQNACLHDSAYYLRQI
jgi:hypothetical protein